MELAVSAHQFQPQFIPPGKPASSSDDVRAREQQAGGALVVEAKNRTRCSSSCRAQMLDRSRLLPANAGWGWDHGDSQSWRSRMKTSHCSDPSCVGIVS